MEEAHATEVVISGAALLVCAADDWGEVDFRRRCGADADTEFLVASASACWRSWRMEMGTRWRSGRGNGWVHDYYGIKCVEGVGSRVSGNYDCVVLEILS